MDNIIFYQEFWFYLLGLIFLIYSLLDGFDLGIGIVLPFIKDPGDRSKLLASVSPFWDGNGVWLISGAGALFAAFPAVFTNLLSGFYLYFLMTIFSMVFRAFSFGLMYHGKGGKIWEHVFSISSASAAAGILFVIGNLLNGLVLSDRSEIISGMGLFNQLTGITILTGVAALTIHGMSYGLLKSGNTFKTDMKKYLMYAEIISCAIYLLFFISIIIKYRPVPVYIIFPGATVAILPIVFDIINGKRSRDNSHFILSSISICGFWIIAFHTLFPAIIRAENNLSLSLTIFNSSSSFSTLHILAMVVVPILFLIAAYTAFVYYIFMNRKTNLLSGSAVMKELVICKSCGYIMRKERLGDKCPACGVPAKLFEPYIEKMSPKRKFLLSLDLHPVLVHFPQAFTISILMMLILTIFISEPIRIKLFNTINVLTFCLPFTVLFSILAGIFDAKLRFRKVDTPIIIRKMAIGGLFLALSVIMFTLNIIYPIDNPVVFLSMILLSTGCLLSGSVLGLMGTTLINSKFPG